MRRATAVVLLAVLAACGNSSPARGLTAAREMLFVGDSLAVEATPVVATKIGSGTTLVSKTYPGIPACEIRQNLAGLIAAHPHPAAIVIETFANQGIPGSCTTPAEQVMGSAAYYARFQMDVTAMFVAARATGAQVVYVMPPEDLWYPDVRHVDLWLAAYAAQQTGVTVGWGGRNQVGGNEWRHDLPCLSSETAAQGCVGGRIVVRSPDLIHFCPVLYPTLAAYTVPGCPVYASGIVRWGRGIAADVRGALSA